MKVYVYSHKKIETLFAIRANTLKSADRKACKKFKLTLEEFKKEYQFERSYILLV